MKILKKPDAFYDVFERKSGPAKQSTHYCPGCGHGNVHKMITEAMVDMGIADRTVFVSPVGCSVFGYYYFDCGNIQAAHGRAAAVATGVKRANPDSIVISYQGDGDLAAIGTAETIHAANRGENITVFFINNAIYGMTGGQMAPTTLINQTTTTTPGGRDEMLHGNPIRVSEMLATLSAPTYIERVAIGTPKQIMKTRKAIRKALKNQVDEGGYSFVEILSACPSGWGMEPPQAIKWLVEDMVKVFPLGVFKDETKTRKGQWRRPVKEYVPEEVTEFVNGMATAMGDALEETELPFDLKCKFAGFGGQGILTLGLFVSQVGMRAGHKVSWFPAYGPEMRGGTANCSVNISANRIGTPMVDNPNVLVVMNQPSLESFEKDVEDGGVILVNTSVVKGRPDAERLNVFLIPASEIADKIGTAKVANVVMLGAMGAATKAFSLEFLETTLHAIVKRKDLIPLNIEAVRAGYAAALEQIS